MATIKVKRSAVAGRVPATGDLELGEIAINTYDGIAYIKKSVSGTETVVPVGSVTLSQNLQNRYQYTATAGQTTFAANYLAPYIDVYLNGVRLFNGADFTATSGTSIVLASAASLGNIIDIVAYTSYTANANFADLNSSHVVAALGFTPYNATNPSNYITTAGARAAISVTGSGSYDSATGVITVTGGVTSVNTRTGAITLTSGDITGALGFTPLSNATSYLPLTGGTLTGAITFAAGQTWPTFNQNTTGSAGSVAWSGVTGTPTTLAGYGITDAQALDADLTAIAALAGTSGFLKKTAANTWALDTNTYLTGNQSISVSGDATGSGTTSVALTLANSGVITGTYTKVTVDAKGRVTTGASLASADLPTYTGTISSAQVTAGLGFTPYNATNPSGYITSSASISGNAATATLLANARNIQGVSFNGSADITVVTAGTGVTVTGTQVSIGQPVATTSNVTFNDLVVSGNLTVNGTTTTINSTTLTVDDKNIELGSIASPSDVTADGGGITLKGATDKTFNWIGATGYWTSSHGLSAPRLISTVASGTAPLLVASNTVVTNLNADLLDGNDASAFALAGHVHAYLSAESDTLATVTARGATTTQVITHGGLAMSSGTNVDQVYSVTDTLTLSASWQDTSINAAELVSGSYVVQVYVNDSAVGGGHYQTYYTGMMSWFSGDTNEASSDEIVLHRAGHASTSGNLYLRILRTFTADTADLKLQISGTTANTGTSTYAFKFRRLI